MGFLTACCRSLGLTHPRVRTWQRCAWLAGIRPTSKTTLRHIHGDVDPDLRCAAMRDFCERVLAAPLRPFDVSGLLSLYTLRSPFVLHTWNVTSLRSQRDATHKVRKIRSMADQGVVLLQETHLAANDPLALRPSLPHCDVRSSMASQTEKGGTSGGLAFVVPTHLGYQVEGSIVEVLPGLLAWLGITYCGLRFRCWNVYAVPHRKAEVFTALKAECQRLQAMPAGDPAHAVLDVFAGDLNLSPLRDADAKLFDVAATALRLRCARFSTLDAAAAQGTFRNCHGPHWIDHAGGVEAREGSTSLQWRLHREQLKTLAGHHCPLKLVGSLRQQRMRAEGRSRALPASLFIGQRAECEDLVRRLSKTLTDGGLPLDVLTARRRAFTESCGRHGDQSLLQPAQDLADACVLGRSPLCFFSTMESQIHRWAKDELCTQRASAAQQLRAALDGHGGREIRVPADVWRVLHAQLDLPTLGTLDKDEYVVARAECEAILVAHEAFLGRSCSHESPDDADSMQLRRYRKIFPKVAAFDERLATEAGLTDDPQVLDELYAASREFWYRSPWCDEDAQAQHLGHYAQFVVSETQIAMDIPSVAELHHVVVNTPDSSPGYGGVPFAAWRLVSLGVAMLLRCFFRQLLRDSAATLDESPLRHQLTRWIPKRVHGHEATSRRPLGVSSSFYRLVNAVLHRMFMQNLGPRMHPTQAMFRDEGEALQAVSHMQEFLDIGTTSPYASSSANDSAYRSAKELVAPWLAEEVNEQPGADGLRIVSLSDFNKAFERVSPRWIMLVLCAWGVPL